MNGKNRFTKAICLLIMPLFLFLAVPFLSDEALADGSKVMVLTIGDPIMTINGAPQEIDPGRGTTPLIDSGSTLLPIRAIVEAMGGTIAWHPEYQSITMIVNGRSVIRMWFNNSTAEVNRVKKTLSVPAKSINGRTMVPVRFVSENLNCTVDWNGAAQQVTITYTEDPNDRNNWTGMWESAGHFENFVMIQTGDKIYAEYNDTASNIITGTVTGNMAVGTYQTENPSVGGDIEMTLSEDGKMFTYKYRIKQERDDPDAWYGADGDLFANRKLGD